MAKVIALDTKEARQVMTYMEQGLSLMWESPQMGQMGFEIVHPFTPWQMVFGAGILKLVFGWFHWVC